VPAFRRQRLATGLIAAGAYRYTAVLDRVDYPGRGDPKYTS
jgi:hypothetical protein